MATSSSSYSTLTAALSPPLPKPPLFLPSTTAAATTTTTTRLKLWDGHRYGKIRRLYDHHHVGDLTSYCGMWVVGIVAPRGGLWVQPAAAVIVHSLWHGVEKPDAVSLEAISSEAQFDQVLAEAQQANKSIVIDWMANWCRKCIYLKPKLEKLAAEYHPDIKFYYIDVNAVPQAVVRRAEVTKMPTIQLWKNGEKKGEVIGGHKAWLVLDEIREMLQGA